MRKTRSSRVPSSVRWLWLAGLPALGFLSVSADTVAWTGAGTDTNWSNANNWNPGVPADGDEVAFSDMATARNVTLNGAFSPSKLFFTNTGFNDYVVDGSGSINGTDVVLQKDGDAWLTLGGSNNFTGEILLNSGLLKLASQTGGISTTLGASGNTIRIASGATLDINGQGSAAHTPPTTQAGNHRFHTVEIAGNGIEISEGVFSGAITSTTNLTYGGWGKSGLRNVVLTEDASIHAPTGITFDVGVGGYGAVASGSITSSGEITHTLTKTGEGALHIGGTNAGVIIHVAEGTLFGNGGGADTPFGDKLIIGEGAIVRTGIGFGGTFSVPIEIGDGGRLSVGGSLATFDGPITSTGTVEFGAWNTQNLVIASNLDVPGNVVVLRESASGNVIFTGDNLLDGTLVISGSIIAQIGSGGETGSFKDDNGADSPIHLGTTGTVAINRSDDLVFDAPITGVGTFTKQGGNTVRRTIESGFSRPGGTVANVSAGTLLINNSTGYGLGEGAISVSAAGTLGGTGAVASTVTLSGTIAPGDGPWNIATFTTGSLNLATSANATIQIEVDGGTADRLVVDGDVNLLAAAIANLSIASLAPPTEAAYPIIEYTGELHGDFHAISGLPEGYRIRHDAENKVVLLEASEEAVNLPRLLYYDGGTTNIEGDGNAAATASNGVWNTTVANWDQGPAAHIAWPSGESAVAHFATGTNTVTINDPAPLSLAGIRRFGTTTNTTTTITGGVLHLEPGAVLQEGHYGSGSGNGLQINSKLTGTGGFTVLGRLSSGTNLSRVILSNPVPNDNTISGPVAIQAGHLRLQTSHQLGNATVVTVDTLIAGSIATLESGSGVNETIAGLHFGPNGGELKLGGTGVSELTLDGDGLSIANAATFTYGNSASGIRLANGGELAKSGTADVTIARVNAANFIDLGGVSRTLRVSGSGVLNIGVNLLNGGVVKQGEGTLVLSSNTNSYAGNTTVAQGALRLVYPTLHDDSALSIASGASLQLAFATAETTDVVHSLTVAGVPLPAGVYGPSGTTLPGVTPLAAISGTGLLSVQFGGGSSDPYGDWATSFGLDPESVDGAPTGDFDKDGLANAVEYLLGANPASGALTHLPTAARQGGNLVFTFTREKEAVQAGFVSGVEWSTTLSGWTDAEAGWISITDNDDTETVTAVIPVPGGAEKIFARLKVTAP